MELSTRLRSAACIPSMSPGDTARTDGLALAAGRGRALRKTNDLVPSAAEAVVDGELVRRFNGGDEAAFGQIVARYRERIQGLADRFLRNHADAEEITQDTFIRAHRGLARFRGDSSLSTWLHRIASNLARNRYWYFHRRCRHLTCSLDAPVSENTSATAGDLVATPEADPARQATVDEFLGLVTICMGRLDASHREILKLRNQLHFSYDEIALALGTNAGTVKSRIARARGKLRELLSDACPEFPADAATTDWFEPANRVAATA